MGIRRRGMSGRHGTPAVGGQCRGGTVCSSLGAHPTQDKGDCGSWETSWGSRGRQRALSLQVPRSSPAPLAPSWPGKCIGKSPGPVATERHTLRTCTLGTCDGAVAGESRADRRARGAGMVHAQCLNTSGLLGAAGLSSGRRPDPALKIFKAGSRLLGSLWGPGVRCVLNLDDAVPHSCCPQEPTASREDRVGLGERGGARPDASPLPPR